MMSKDHSNDASCDDDFETYSFDFETYSDTDSHTESIMSEVSECQPSSDTRHSPLGDLPIELWIQIVGFVDSARSMCMLSMATRGFRDFLSDMDELWHPTTPTYKHLVYEITGKARPTIIARTLFGLSRRSRCLEIQMHLSMHTQMHLSMHTHRQTREEMAILRDNCLTSCNLELFDWMPMCLNDYNVIPNEEKEIFVADILLSVIRLPKEFHGRRNRVNAILGDPRWLRYLCSDKTPACSSPPDSGVQAAIQAKHKEALLLAVRLGDWKVVRCLLQLGLANAMSVTEEEAEQCLFRYGPGIPVLLMGAGARYTFGEAVFKNVPTHDCTFIFVGKMPTEMQRPKISL